MTRVPLWLRSVFHDDALTELQHHRRLDSETPTERSRWAILAAGLLVAVVLGFLVMMSVQRQQVGVYYATHARIVLPSDADVDWQVSRPIANDCYPASQCYRKLMNQEGGLTPTSSQALGTAPALPEGVKQGVVLTRFTIPKKLWKEMSEVDDLLVVGLPLASYDRIDVFLDGVHTLTQFRGYRVGVPFTIPPEGRGDLVVDAIFEYSSDQDVLLENESSERFLLTTMPEYRAYLRTLTMSYAGRGAWISDLSRIVMSAFLLVLYLFVDSSAEVLGLALVTGLQAFAMSLDFGWIPVHNPYDLGATARFLSFVFQVYFLLQMTRLGRRAIGPWVKYGGTASVAFGFAWHYANSYGWSWPDTTLESMNFVVGLFGCVLTARVAFLVARRGLRWRTGSLVVASMACLFQTVDPMSTLFPWVRQFEVFYQIRDLLTPASSYFLAISAFINISTLENRVKSLSEAEAKSKMMEQELELGRTVQHAFLKMPVLPASLDLATHYEAAKFVSGDSYFVDWHEPSGRLAIVVTDVTGNGVQAALKSSACQVIARTLWSDAAGGGSPSSGSNLSRYEQLVSRFFGETSNDPDIPAIMGFEFHAKTGMAELFRANFAFPFVVRPSAERRIEMLPLKNQQVTRTSMTPGMFVLILSDGFLGTSRDAKVFVNAMRERLAANPDGHTAASMRDLVLECAPPNLAHLDDRTIVVFRWNGPANT